MHPVFPALLLGAAAIIAFGDSPIESCPRLTHRSPPEDVKDLKPIDIRVVGALGDSITAGFAERDLPYEDRAEVWATGNATGAITISNFLRHYGNPIASHNVAVSGDIVQGMAQQANRLVMSLQTDRSVDFQNDWKLVTILIGGNNQCKSCFGHPSDTDSKIYAEELSAALDILQKGLPRAVVSLVSMLSLDSLVTAPGIGEHCQVAHIRGKKECPCPFLDARSAEIVRNVTEADNAVLFEVAEKFQRKDFSVVVQPGTDRAELPDWTYVSRFDCFHPGLKSHQEIAKSHWANLFEAVGKKTRKFQMPIKMYCPTDDDVIYTRAHAGGAVVV